MRPRRAKGSWTLRLAGVGVVVVLAAGGLTYYLGSQHPAPSKRHHQRAALSSRVVKAQTVGIIDFGPDDDGDAFANDTDDHPLMLRPARSGRLVFAVIPPSVRANGTPKWTANQMGDGSEIFIYTPTGRCLTAGQSAGTVLLARCNLSRSQRWQPVHAGTVLGQAVAAYANALTHGCLTAPPPKGEHGSANPGPAILTPCGPARDKKQEIAFWWSA